MDGKIRLHIGEGGDDDAPYAFNRIERKQPLMPTKEIAHHGGLAARAKRRAPAELALYLNKTINDASPLHQQTMHGRVDTVDLNTEIGEYLIRILLVHEVVSNSATFGYTGFATSYREAGV
jgi:hypothetical protein